MLSPRASRPRPTARRRLRPGPAGLALLLALAAGGCRSLPDGRAWGEDATLLPGMGVLKHAAAEALTDPWTWAPAAGAVVLHIEDWDEGISDWAREETPIFGSTEHAAESSDDWRSGLELFALGSSLATSSGEDPRVWVPSKLKGLGVELAASQATGSLTDFLKDQADRTRPNGKNDSSLPSGHTSASFSHAVWASGNLDSIAIPEAARVSLRIGAYAAAAGVAWGRVESGDHFPTDVLWGAALGNFVTVFVREAFLGLPENVRLNVEVEPATGTLAFGVAVSL